MKKLIALVLALVMVLAVTAVAFAADDGSVTITNAVPGETYKLYKVFDLTYKTAETSTGTLGGDTPQTGVSYTFTKTDSNTALYTALTTTTGEDASPFTLTESTTANVYNVTSSANAATIAAWLKKMESKLAKIGSDQVAPDAETGKTTSTVSWTGLAYGYYYATSSVGSTVTVDSTLKDVKIQDKNSVPGEDKKQSKTDGNYADTQLNMNIGDTVYYQVEITDGKGTDKAIVLTDALSTGLTLNQDSITVTKGGTAVATTNYSITEKGAQGFKLTLTADYVATLNENDVVLVKYTATINSNAVINGAGNTNTATLDYSEQHFTDTTVVKTYDFIVYKTDGTSFLDGAEFKIYTAATGGEQILITDDGNGRYHKDTAAAATVTIDINSATGCNVRGLEPGDYYLEEVVVPNGYNALTERKKVTVVADQTAAATITVVNSQGTELPSTGGIGTTIFYILGGLLVIGAAVILVARRKAQD